MDHCPICSGRGYVEEYYGVMNKDKTQCPECNGVPTRVIRIQKFIARESFKQTVRRVIKELRNANKNK